MFLPKANESDSHKIEFLGNLPFVVLPLGCLLFFFFMVTVYLPSAHSACFDKICFDDVSYVGGQALPVRGTGLLEFLGFDLYTAVLYVPEDAKKIMQVLAPETPRKLVLYYKRGMKVKWMNKTAEQVIKKNQKFDFKLLEEHFEAIGSAYQKVGEGDRYALEYNPVTKETMLLLNEQPVISIPGEDFAEAYMGIWLSEYPANHDLRDHLLGLNKRA